MPQNNSVKKTWNQLLSASSTPISNPSHEKRTGQILREALPTLSSPSRRVAPSFGSISGQARRSSTLPSDLSSGVTFRVLKRDCARRIRSGTACDAEQRRGFTFEAASEKPVFMVESGPAAGVIAATYLGTTLGCPDVISFDMGGTTAKAGLIQNGTPTITKDYEVGTALKPAWVHPAAQVIPSVPPS